MSTGLIIASHARVVHSVVEREYHVQYKTWLLGKWISDAWYGYYQPGETPSPHSGRLTTQEGALDRAHVRMKTLLGRAVVLKASR